MKVIFLDFDGVINNWECFNGIDYNNVKYLLKIIESTGARVVATTSIKYSFQKGNNVNYEDTLYFKYITCLKNMGIEIDDVTPNINHNRLLEINEYLNLHPEISDFLILDDEFVGDKFKEHQVLLDLYNGICEEHVKPSIDILNGSLGFYPPNFNFDETIEERMIRINRYHSEKNIKKK